MKTDIIPTKTHSIIDYATAACMLGLPLLLSGKKKGAETYLPMAMGAGVLVQSLFTAYEGGAKKAMPMKSHLQMDYFSGALLAAAPFIFGFRKRSWAPHVALGLSELLIAYLTKPEPKKKKRFFGLIG